MEDGQEYSLYILLSIAYNHCPYVVRLRTVNMK